MDDKTRQAKLRAALPTMRTKFKELREKIDNMGGLVLQVMRHKEATPEQVLDLHQRYTNAYAGYIQLRETLRKAYPEWTQNSFLNPYPWWSNK